MSHVETTLTISILCCNGEQHGHKLTPHHSHEDDVCRRRGFRVLCKYTASYDQLLHDLSCCQVPQQSHSPGVTELTVHGTSHLAADANGDALLLPLHDEIGQRVHASTPGPRVKQSSISSTTMVYCKKGRRGCVLLINLF